MLRALPLSLCLLSLVGQGDAALITARPNATPTINARSGPKIDAIVPTTVGQIGINPVESDLGDPSTYLGTIYGTDTLYITMNSATTEWMGSNTKFLSMDGTSTVVVVFATATAAANGQNIGDISVILPEGLADTLTNSMTTAIDACGVVVTKKMRREMESRESRDNLRRQVDAVLSCVFQYAKIDAEDGKTFDAYLEATKWLDAGIELAQDAPAVLVNYIGTLGKAEAVKTLVWLALFSIAVDITENQVLSGQNAALSPVGKVNIPASGFATKPPNKGCDGTEEVTEESPLCLNDDCQGEATGLCTIPPNTKCPCIRIIPKSPGAQPWNQSWTDFQQQWLLDVFNGGGTSDDPGGQQIAVASYINPLGDPAAWDRLLGYPAYKISILVANVMNGPDSTVDASWTDVITRGAASGKTVLGYVRTGYLGVSSQQYITRLGSGGLSDWTAQIEQDVNMWYKLYPNLGGIFFDEGWPECGDSNQYVDLYKYINDFTKRAHPGALTVLNAGSPVASCFEDSMDTLLTFERDYNAYMNSYTGNNWVPKDPRKLWHIIYDVPASEVSNVAQLAASRGAGFVQITDDVLPNPYDTLPSDSYMQSQLGAVAGGLPLNNDASAWPSGGTAVGAVGSLTLVASDYSSASLSWTAASNALGYYVYLADTDLTASVPSSMTSITIGGLTPSKTYEFHVLPVGYGGTTGFSSNRVTVYTKTLPGGLTITNYGASPSGGSSTYHADVLIPYAFVHLYIWDSIECDFDTNPGWPINFVVDDYVCTHYMVEDTTLYKYTGTVPSGSTAAPWAWTEIGPITRVITGYTYTWTLPLGTLTTDTTKFVVQVQGYNPYTTIFEPDPTDYDCKGSTLCTTPGMLAWCDDAVNNLGRNDSLSYTTSNNSQTGNCWGDGTRSCGVFIQGSNCAVSGNDMWWDYQNIRKIGGCKKCGSYHRDDGCLITINYVYKCDVGQGGPLFS